MSLENIRYVVFDLNGTLVVEDYLRHDEVLEVILKCRRRGRGMTVEDLRDVSKGNRSLKEMIARLYTVDNPAAVACQFLEIQSSRIVFREKTLDILSELQGRYKLILCSDTTGIAKMVVKKLDLSRYFIKVLYSCDVGYLKSEEEFWTNLLSYFHEARSTEFLVVGDNPRADTYHPKRLGMHTIQIKNPIQLSLDYRERSIDSDEEKPECCIKDLEEILPLLGIKTKKRLNET